MRRLVVVALVLGCGGPPAQSFGDDETGCEGVGCIDGVTLILRAEQDAFVPGDYTLLVTWADEGEHSCTFSVSNDPERCPETNPCPDEGTCDATFGFDATPQQLSTLVQATPAGLDVRVERDGEPVVDQSFAPDYDQTHPCDGGCSVAEVSIDVP